MRTSMSGVTTIEEFDNELVRYKKDAEAGDASAQYNLAICYERGTGVAINLREAVKLYTLSAEQGVLNARQLLFLWDWC